jgi:hypothetical protein
VRAVVFDQLGDLPASGQLLLAGSDSFALSACWLAATEAAALPAGAKPVLVLCGETALFPMMAAGGQLLTMTTPYSWAFAPIAAVPADSPALAAAAAAFGGVCRRWPVVRIEALDAAWPGLPALVRGLRQAGLVVRRFEHFGNWHEPIGGRGWAAYLRDRPGALREVLRRRTRDGGATLRYEMIDSPADIERGIAVYEQVYARSWKVAEPHPEFGPTLMRAAAAEGALRLAVLWQQETPVAAQYWVLRGGTATVLKLAHDEAARALSPGTLLTAWAIRGLIERDGIAQLDFGRGDDPYKRLWASERGQRIGLLAGAPWRPAGLAAIGRQMLGELRRYIVRRATARDATS